MPHITIVTALLLTALGLIGYFGSAEANPSKTALIPAAFGLVLLALGLVALIDRLRKHAMHGAAAIGLVGLLAAGGRAAMKIGVLFSDDPTVSKRPVVMSFLMAAICLVFVALCIKSFIDARQRQAAVASENE
jgi:uncharacterized membrane-anchored protein